MGNFLDEWFTKVEPHLFVPKKGFFELPYLANSPEAIVESFARMPYVQHSIQAQTIRTENEYMNAGFHYEKLEEGLWFMFSSSEFKANINFNRVENKNLPSDYYLLSLEIQEGSHSLRPGFINGIPYSGRTWLLFKPQASRTSSHLKGTIQQSLTLFFSEAWLKEHLYKFDGFQQSALWYFFESGDKFIITPDSFQATDELAQPLQELISHKGEQGAADKAGLRKLLDKFLHHFIKEYNSDETGKGLLELGHIDRQKIVLAEKLLVRNIYGGFPGIEKLAVETGISTTKLKVEFKLVFEKTLFQYYQEKQMHFAYEMLLRRDGKIKDIAKLFGYSNPGKFAAVFKKHIGKSPSEI